MHSNSNVKIKHLTLDDRVNISEGLKLNLPINHIARQLGKDPTTIAKEIRRNRVYSPAVNSRVIFNHCVHRTNCSITGACERNCSKRCSTCAKCNSVCNNYQKEKCQKLALSPHVCNGCQKHNCRYEKFYYRPEKAHKQYRLTLSECRSGISLSESELAALDSMVSPLIRDNSQSLAHIYATHHSEIPICSRTFYTYVDKCILSAKNIDLPRKVRYKPRKKTKIIKDTKIRIGRTYEDFLQYLENNPGVPVVELDSVEGSKGGAVLLTILFRACHLMLGFLRAKNDAQSVIDIFDALEEKLGLELFRELFPVILTDNGTEFSWVERIEVNRYGEPRTRVFFCDPRAAQQKGKLENNHTMIRRVLPKGNPFDPWDQTDFNRLMNHINSYRRLELHNCSAYQLAELMFGRKTLNLLDVIEIPSDMVTLNSSLLKQ